MEKDQSRLLSYFRRLPQAERDTLVAFAQFLAQRSGPEVSKTEPEKIPRPEKESVIAAVKRLSATYPMLDKSKMLNQTSDLVGQHLLQGRAAEEVIDELELVFRHHYEVTRGA